MSKNNIQECWGLYFTFTTHSPEQKTSGHLVHKYTMFIDKKVKPEIGLKDLALAKESLKELFKLQENETVTITNCFPIWIDCDLEEYSK